MPINNNPEEYVHILIEITNHTQAPVKMRELSNKERDDMLHTKQIFLCEDRHQLILIKDGEAFDIEPITKIYHPNIGRNAMFN